MAPSPDARVRTMLRSDVPTVARLAAEFAQFMRDLGDTTAFRLDAAAIERDGFGLDPAFAGLVALEGGRVAGYLLHHDGYDSDAARRVLFVADLFVQATARGRGLGAALMLEAGRIASMRGAAQLVWTVDTRNVAARRFYERIGGEVVEAVHLMSMDTVHVTTMRTPTPSSAS